MTLIRKCDLCKKEMSQIDRIYFVSYGEKSSNILMKGKGKTGEICYDCCKKVEESINKLKA